jgi:hypothetical protein
MKQDSPRALQWVKTTGVRHSQKVGLYSATALALILEILPACFTAHLKTAQPCKGNDLKMHFKFMK